MINKEYVSRLIVTLVCCAPMAVMAAGWDQTLNEYGRNIRIGLYLIGGTIALSMIVWSGIRWMIARGSGDHSHTFIDYLQQVGVTIVVGGSIVLGAAAWQVFGSGNPT